MVLSFTKRPHIIRDLRTKVTKTSCCCGTGCALQRSCELRAKSMDQQAEGIIRRHWISSHWRSLNIDAIDNCRHERHAMSSGNTSARNSYKPRLENPGRNQEIIPDFALPRAGLTRLRTSPERLWYRTGFENAHAGSISESIMVPW